MRSNPNRGTIHACETEPGLSALEAVARETIGMRRGRPLTDAEWAPISRDLLELARIIRNATQGGSREEMGDWTSVLPLAA